MRYKSYQLSDIAIFKYGKMPEKELITDTGFPIFTGYKYVGYYPSYNVEKRSVIIVARGVGGTGDVKIVPKQTYLTNLSILVTFNEVIINIDYFYYMYLHNNLRYLDTGTAQSQITINDLKKLEIKLPELEYQNKIVNILKTIDRKVNNNKITNNKLEELAQTLYKHWFVDFEFPNEEGLPYKSSGGKMVESELGLIPEGWIIEPLGNSKISKLITSGINKFNNEKIYLATADVTNTTITNRNTTITMEDKPSRANMQPRENTLWFAKMKNSRKLIRVSRNSTELISDYIFSTGFAGLYVENYLNFVWTFLLTPSFNEIKDTLASGTTQEAINNININKINLLIPKEKTLNKFEKILNSVYGKIEQNDNENRRLEKLRDLLLPKLMSGEIRVPIKE